MRELLGATMVALLGAALTPACAAPVEQDRASAEPSASNVGRQSEAKLTGNSASISERYRTLDEYLAFLESRSAIDGHWYREIRPGIYRLETGNLRGVEPEQRIFTREELERKFGFLPE